LAHFFLFSGRSNYVGQMLQNVQDLIEPVIVSMGYELVGLEYIPGKHSATLRLFIDSRDGITVDDCSSVSHQVSGLLDVEDPLVGRYTLEVSSPGLDRPLFKLAHYEAFLGHRVKLRLRVPLNNRRKFTGVIKAVEGNDITVLTDDEEFQLNFDLIEKANLIPVV